MVDYTKDEDFATIKRLTLKGIIDTVYVRFADEAHDRGYDCLKPSEMIELKYIIAGYHPKVVGWRLHNHKREAKNVAVARSIMKQDEKVMGVNAKENDEEGYLKDGIRGRKKTL